MPKPSKTKPAKPVSHNFPVVGIGASAGGLDAYKRLLKTVPEDSGMAYILVQHLDPTHKSLLPEILSKVTQIPVHQVTDNINLAPDHIYIIPANKLLVAIDGILKLEPRPPKDIKNMPIDVFFTSLAEVHKKFAVGILLSGTGTDGTLGLKSIKENGGVTFSQEPASASYNNMPQAAIDAGVVDFIFTPEKIMQQVLRINFQLSPSGNLNKKEDIAPNQKDEILRQILSLLRARRFVDFDYYKQNTIKRRISRRMVINNIKKTSDYLEFLKTNTGELDLLFEDMLIQVTEFFRDVKPFKELKERVFPLITKEKSASEPLRIWVAGCSTGEEAYSIAIGLYQFLGNETSGIKIQIFATDISENAISIARSGMYAQKQLEMFSTSQLDQFFTKVDGHFQVIKFIRDMCVFARHNFLNDPPFANLDMVSCRNVLIYMESFLQKKALGIFHYALKENGFLLLGKSETTTGSPDLFVSVDKHEKIYSKKGIHNKFGLKVFQDRKKNGVEAEKIPWSMQTGRPDFQKTADDILLQEYTPAGVVINEQLDIVHFRGDISPFLTPPSGMPTTNILKMARQGLSFELRNGIHKSKTTNTITVRDGIPIQLNGTENLVTIKIIPLPKTIEPYFLILFHDTDLVPGITTEQKKSSKKLKQKNDPKDLRIQQLELELSQCREDMRSITEDQEASNEELQSANEELLSGSEELQSLNEELETSKEELQSTNEELLVVNQELLESNARINDARKYSDSIIATIHEPLVVLNKDCIVKNANSSFYKTFHVTPEQTEGKLLYELGNHQWDVPAWRILLQNVIPDKKNVSNFEISHVFPVIGKRDMLLNASLMQTETDKEQLILLAIEDITERKIAERKLEAMNKTLEGKVLHRTKALEKANKSLDGSNQQLQQSNDDLQQFAHVASHDLKEPLRKIKTFSSRLEIDPGTVFSEKGKTYLSKLQSASDRMLYMIDGVLAYSIFNATEVPIETVDLKEIMEQIETDLEILILQKEATLEFDKLPQIEGAPVLIYQLFYNLINNSLKFTKEEVKQIITIKSKLVRRQDKDYAEIVLMDTGIGFDQIEVEKIFKSFTMLNPKDKYEGTGLGLSLCKKIVLRHGGTITASSSQNKGAIFQISLPLKQSIPII